MSCRPSHLKPLQVGETSALRTLTKLRHPNNSLHNPPNTLLYEYTGITPILDRLKVLNTKFANRLSTLEDVKSLFIKRNVNINAKCKFPTNSIFEHFVELFTVIDS